MIEENQQRSKQKAIKRKLDQIDEIEARYGLVYDQADALNDLDVTNVTGLGGRSELASLPHKPGAFSSAPIDILSLRRCAASR